MSRKARRPLTRPPAKSGPGSRAAAVGFFALLPIAVALGVVVGRAGAGGDESEALLRALRSQEAATASTAGGATTASTAGKAKKKAKAGRSPGKPEEKVVAKTENGDVHEVTHFHASKQKEEEDTQTVEENPEQTGENYIKAQQNLPDVIVVGGDGGSAPSGNGAEP